MGTSIVGSHLRLRLLSLSKTQHYILIGTHHISMDGHSFPVLMLDIHEAYSKSGRRLPRFPDSSQARAFGAHQRLSYESGQFKPAIEHYRAMFADFDFARPIELFPFSRTQVRPPLDRYGTHVAGATTPRSCADSQIENSGPRASCNVFSHAYLAALQGLPLPPAARGHHNLKSVSASQTRIASTRDSWEALETFSTCSP